jgi:uncharacterized protein (DUF58 family)
VGLTRRGWSVVGAVVGLFVGGRLLGLPQLFVLATALASLLVVAAVWVNTRRLVLAGERVPTERLQVGTDGRVDLTVVNDTDRATPTLALTDSFDGGRRHARFLLAPLRPGEVGRAAYRVPTDRRGRFQLGPLVAACTDPFGLCERYALVADRTEVLVYPRVHELLALPELGGDDFDSHASELVGRPDTGGEFHLLREYDAGDDLRRVSWKATARRGRLMVRQDESKRRAPVLVVFDVRASRHDRASFELAVEAVASVVSSLERAGRPHAVVTSIGEAIGRPGQRHLATVLDALAVIEPIAAERLVPALSGRRGDAVVFVTGRLRDQDAAALDLLVRPGGGLATITCGAEPSDPAPATSGRRRRPPLTVPVHTSDTLTDSWNSAILRWQRPDTTARRAPARP